MQVRLSLGDVSWRGKAVASATAKNVDYYDYDPDFERRFYLQRDYVTIFFPAQVELAFTRP